MSFKASSFAKITAVSGADISGETDLYYLSLYYQEFRGILIVLFS